jgi:hypothetical protein
MVADAPTIAQPEPDRAPSTIDRRDGRDDRDPPQGENSPKKLQITGDFFGLALDHVN